MSNQEGELSTTKLVLLLCLLAGIWVLCYQAEQQLPARHIADTYSRMLDRAVTPESLEVARGLAKEKNDENYADKQKQLVGKKYKLNATPQKSICVVVSHRSGGGMEMIKSILQQDYTQYNLIYFRDESDSTEVFKYLNENSLDKQKIKIVGNPNPGYLSDFLLGKSYCFQSQVAIFLSDEDRLLGFQLFDILNSVFSEAGESKVAYSASLNSDLELGKSFPYPAEIMEGNKYYNYPFVAGGIFAFSTDLYSSVEKSDLSVNEKFYEKAENVAFGVKMLKAAKKNVVYIPEPLLLDRQEQEPLTLDPQLKAEYQLIMRQK